MIINFKKIIDQNNKWLKVSAINILDQFLFSLTNFGINILMARWLNSNDYGIFTIAISVFLISTSLYNSFLLEPMSVFGSKYLDKKSNYLKNVLILHIGYSAIIFLILFVISQLSTAAHYILLILAFFQPFMLLPWLIRRYFYLKFSIINALVASLLYFIITNTAFIFFLIEKSLTPTNGLVCMTLGGGGTIFALLFDKKDFSNRLESLKLAKRDMIHEHLEYGKWIFFSNFLIVAVSQGYVFIAVAELGIDKAGALRALLNFILPISQIFAALNLLFLPILSRDFINGNIEDLIQKTKKIRNYLIIIAFINELFFLLFHYQLVLLLYKGKYLQYENLMPILGLIPIIVAIYTSKLLTLKAVQIPKYESYSNFVAAIVACVSSLVFLKLWVFVGLIYSMVLMYISIGAVISLYFQSKVKNQVNISFNKS